jgi:hypothetical protein
VQYARTLVLLHRRPESVAAPALDDVYCGAAREVLHVLHVNAVGVAGLAAGVGTLVTLTVWRTAARF